MSATGFQRTRRELLEENKTKTVKVAKKEKQTKETHIKIEKDNDLNLDLNDLGLDINLKDIKPKEIRKGKK